MHIVQLNNTSTCMLEIQRKHISVKLQKHCINIKTIYNMYLFRTQGGSNSNENSA